MKSKWRLTAFEYGGNGPRIIGKMKSKTGLEVETRTTRGALRTDARKSVHDILTVKINLHQTVNSSQSPDRRRSSQINSVTTEQPHNWWRHSVRAVPSASLRLAITDPADGGGGGSVAGPMQSKTMTWWICSVPHWDSWRLRSHACRFKDKIHYTSFPVISP